MKGRTQAVQSSILTNSDKQRICLFVLLLLLSPYHFLIPLGFPSRANAQSLEQQFLSVPRRGNYNPIREEGDRALRLGLLQQQSGSLEKAIESWSQALTLYQRIGDLDAMGTAYGYIGKAYADLGQFIEAEEAMRRYLGVQRANKNFQEQVLGLNNVGTMLLRRGSLTAARESFEEAAKIAREIDFTSGIGLSLSNLGLVAAALGDYNQAAKRYEEALIFRRRAADPVGEINTLNNLGDAYLSLNNYSETIAAYGSALRLAQQGGDRLAQIRAIDGLVTAHNRVGRFARTLELLDQRLTLAQQAGDSHEELATLRSLARTYQLSQDLSTSRNYYQRALILAQALGDSQVESLLINQLSNLNRSK